VTEFQSRRELREAERQGLVAKPEQVFDLPTGSIRLPEASEMLTRKRIREMEREGLLDPLTGAVPVTPTTDAVEGTSRTYDEVIAETEEPITSSIAAVVAPAYQEPQKAEPQVQPQAQPQKVEPLKSGPVEPTDFFHNMAVNPASRKPKAGIILGVVLLVLGGAGAAAYMLGIFK
jgi:hypothetical protein